MSATSIPGLFAASHIMLNCRCWFRLCWHTNSIWFEKMRCLEWNRQRQKVKTATGKLAKRWLLCNTRAFPGLWSRWQLLPNESKWNWWRLLAGRQKASVRECRTYVSVIESASDTHTAGAIWRTLPAPRDHDRWSFGGCWCRRRRWLCYAAGTRGFLGLWHRRSRSAFGVHAWR